MKNYSTVERNDSETSYLLSIAFCCLQKIHWPHWSSVKQDSKALFVDDRATFFFILGYMRFWKKDNTKQRFRCCGESIARIMGPKLETGINKSGPWVWKHTFATKLLSQLPKNSIKEIRKPVFLDYLFHCINVIQATKVFHPTFLIRM